MANVITRLSSLSLSSYIIFSYDLTVLKIFGAFTLLVGDWEKYLTETFLLSLS